jgi:hypothetical protein
MHELRTAKLSLPMYARAGLACAQGPQSLKYNDNHDVETKVHLVATQTTLSEQHSATRRMHQFCLDRLLRVPMQVKDCWPC